MNFNVNLLFHLHEAPFVPLGILTPIVPRVSGGVGHNRGKQVCFEIYFRQNKDHIFNGGIHPANLMENSFIFFETTP